MQRVYNFSAGPAMLPLEVLQQIQDELLNWRGTGASVMELTHRGDAFMKMATDCDALMRKLLNIPDNYHVLFLPGGATMQFSGVPLNILQPGQKSGYIVTGIWSQKSYEIATAYGQAEIIAKAGEQDGLGCLPSIDSLTEDYAYLYYTSNETINGLQYQSLPATTEIPFVCDMTSSLMSEPVDINQYGVIFASAQKNLGQAGITIVIARDDLIQQPQPIVPSIINYKKQASQDSMLNTPPTFAWYVCYLMLRWIDDNGGVSAMQTSTKAKAEKVYACIDASPLYQSIAHPNSRSLLNMPFRFTDSTLESEFLAEAEQQGLINLKGHRLTGGIRPSIYIGMPMAGVETLVAFMADFANRKG